MSNKTIGIYKITSNFNTEDIFKLVGASSQIEVCTRDYMNWCKKGKAPKIMQVEFDRVEKEQLSHEPGATFKVEILKAVSTIEDLAAAKTEFGLGNKGGKPKTDKPAVLPEPVPEIDTTVIDEIIEAFDVKPEPQGVPVAFVEEIIGETLTLKHSAKLDYKALFEAYKSGKMVKDICEENGISKSSFYKHTSLMR